MASLKVPKKYKISESVLGAIILAAGESRRMGELKPLIKIAGKNLLQHIVDRIRGVGIYRIIVVLGYQAEYIQVKCGLEDVQFIINENYPYGQFSSLQKGVNAFICNCEAVVVCLADQPQISMGVLNDLISTYQKKQPLVIVPKYHGRRGHPVMYNQKIFTHILEKPPTNSAKELMQEFSSEIVEVLCDDPGILYDADTPEDIDKIRSYMSNESLEF